MLRRVLRWLAAGAGAWAADWIVNRFVLRDSDDAPSGFITRREGFGLDDVIRYTAIAFGALTAVHFMPSGGA
jgi:hypothetical protein